MKFAANPSMARNADVGWLPPVRRRAGGSVGDLRDSVVTDNLPAIVFVPVLFWTVWLLEVLPRFTHVRVLTIVWLCMPCATTIISGVRFGRLRKTARNFNRGNAPNATSVVYWKNCGLRVISRFMTSSSDASTSITCWLGLVAFSPSKRNSVAAAAKSPSEMVKDCLSGTFLRKRTA